MKPIDILLAVGVAVIWGVGFVLTRIALDEMSSTLLTTLRFGITALPCLFLPRPKLSWALIVAISWLLVTQFLAPGFSVQVVVFAVFAAGFIALGLKLRRPRKPATLNTPNSGLVGRQAVALNFTGRTGRVRVGDSDWSARLAAGTEPPQPDALLRVVGVDGTTLVVGPP